MKISIFSKITLLLFVMVWSYGCHSSKPFSGFDYDPPDVTNTNTRQITEARPKIIGVGNPKVWLSTEFAGARAANFYQTGKDSFVVEIEPELSPVNNSPWYAFALHSEVEQNITLTLSYKDAKHRYHPKISRDGFYWRILEDKYIHIDSLNGTATLALSLNKKPLWVSAQPIATGEMLIQKLKRWKHTTQNLELTAVGRSHNNREIIQLLYTPEKSAGMLIVIGRQHPPEVTGYLAQLSFLDEIFGDSELSKRFRKSYSILVFPVLNPDGAIDGHWRYNAGGVDLNRDWQNFNQPETAAAAESISREIVKAGDVPVFGVDFHSTDESIFYPLLPGYNRKYGAIADEWIQQIIKEFPQYTFNVEAFDNSAPIFKNWLYNTFGADALTYEVDDAQTPETLDSIARIAAQKLMQILLTKTTFE